MNHAQYQATADCYDQAADAYAEEAFFLASRMVRLADTPDDWWPVTCGRTEEDWPYIPVPIHAAPGRIIWLQGQSDRLRGKASTHRLAARITQS